MNLRFSPEVEADKAAVPADELPEAPDQGFAAADMTPPVSPGEFIAHRCTLTPLTHLST